MDVFLRIYQREGPPLHLPFLILTLFLVILFRALTVGERFQREKLSDKEVEFLNPDPETKLGRQRRGRVS